jgi:hypothetical protein
MGEVETQLHASLSSTLDGDEWSVSCSGRFTPGTLWIGRRKRPTAGLSKGKVVPRTGHEGPEGE